MHISTVKCYLIIIIRAQAKPAEVLLFYKQLLLFPFKVSGTFGVLNMLKNS